MYSAILVVLALTQITPFYFPCMIAQFTVEFGINSTCNALNSIRLRLMLFNPKYHSKLCYYTYTKLVKCKSRQIRPCQSATRTRQTVPNQHRSGKNFFSKDSTYLLHIYSVLKDLVF